MPSTGSSILPSPQSASNTTVTIFNLTVALANTEQSQALPANTKEFIIRTRGNTELKLAYVATESGTKYITVPKNATHVVTQFFTSQTIYFQSPTAGDVVELVAFS